MASSRVAKLVYGVFIAAGTLGFVELLAHRMWGDPPLSDLLVRAVSCELRAEAGRSWMECAHSGNEPTFGAPTTKTRPRIAILGGSSVRDPFKAQPNDNFPEHLQARLPEFEVLNLGKAGMSMTGVAYIASQLADLEPDLVVLYEGHNDYSQTVFSGPIRGVTLWTLPIERLLSRSWIHARINQGLSAQRGALRSTRPGLPAGAPDACSGPGSEMGIFAMDDRGAIDRREAITERYRNDLRAAVRAAPAPVIVSTLLRNFDNPPMAEVAPAGGACEQALSCLANVNLSDNATLARWSAEVCGEGTVTWWRRARAAVDQGDLAAAADAFHRSLALDPAPLRAPYDADEVVRAVAAEEGATLLDLEAAIGPLPPARLFHDTLHLSTEGAEAVAVALEPLVRSALSNPAER